jgi:hypothetical protein
MEKIAAHGVNITGFLPDKGQDNGDIVRGKRPEDIFLPTDFTEA